MNITAAVGNVANLKQAKVNSARLFHAHLKKRNLKRIRAALVHVFLALSFVARCSLSQVQAAVVGRVLIDKEFLNKGGRLDVPHSLFSDF